MNFSKKAFKLESSYLKILLIMSRAHSIKGRLIAMIMIASVSVILLSTISLTTYHIRVLLQHLETEAATLTKLMGTSVSAAMVFFEYKSAKDELANLKVKPEVVHAVLFDKYGKFVAAYNKKGVTDEYDDLQQYSLQSYYQAVMQEAVDLPNGINSGVTEKYIKTKVSTILKNGLIKWNKNNFGSFRLTAFREVHPISTESESYAGFVAIQFDLHKSVYQLFYTIILVTFGVLFAVVVVFIFANRMQKRVSTPICSLLDTMQNVSRHKNYALRANVYFNDELGKLTEEFNEMLSQIEMRDQDLDIYRNHLEEKVALRTKELETVMKQAVSANKAKSRFIANMSHEIRTPLNAVIGFSQILLMEPNLTEQHKSHVKNIDSSGTHLLGLINEILEFSKIDADAIQLTQEPFYLDELIHTLDAMFSMRCQQKHIGWSLQSSIKLGHGVIGDQGKLRQILINLLGNATKFTEHGDVSFRISQQGNIYKFEVEDTGPGIDSEAQKNIFSPFHQEKLGLDKGGAGLGLAISKHYVELMHGELHLISEKDKGTCFSIHLVLPPADTEVLADYSFDVPVKHLRLPVDSKLSALVVDDIEDNRQTLLFILNAIGAEVAEAENGKQALWQAKQKRPDIIFMDIRMPIMNGREALLALNSLFKKNSPPCVAVTASAFAEDSEQLHQDGFAEVIAKPFRFAQIYQCIKNLLEINLVEAEQTQQPLSYQFSDMESEKLLQQLPEHLLQEFREAAQLCELTRLTRLLNELKENSNEYEIIIDCFQNYLSNYDMDGLLAFLDKAYVN